MTLNRREFLRDALGSGAGLTLLPMRQTFEAERKPAKDEPKDENVTENTTAGWLARCFAGLVMPVIADAEEHVKALQVMEKTEKLEKRYKTKIDDPSLHSDRENIRKS